MDFITLGLSVGSIAIVPIGAIVKKSYTDAKRLTVLETNYEHVKLVLTDLKTGQKDTNDKLDTLIQRFI